jgi:hypothetical protein
MMARENFRNKTRRPQGPRRGAPIGTLPEALTLFLSRDERQRVLAVLARHDPDRRVALFKALGIDVAREERRSKEGGR